MECCGRRFDTGQPVRLSIDGGRVARVRYCAEGEATGWPWIAPGFFDLQVNGYGGHEFSSAALNVDAVDAVARAMLACGVTRFCPTVTTNAMDVLLHAMATIDRACRERPDVSRRIAGIHLEGPYISAEDGPRGAHPREHCRPPCWDEFQRLQRAAGGRIRLVTLSPEYPEAAVFVSRAVASGVVVAIGHTAANGAQIGAAVDAGARLSTHLGNGAHRLLPRHPNYIWNQLADDRLNASLIVDGHHLPADVVRVFVRAKSPGRCILVSDMAAQAGLPPGRYRGGLCEVEILPTGRLVIAGQAELLAGATAPLGTGIVQLVADGAASLDEAVRMASHQPAALMGLPCGGFEPGEIADFVVFDLLPVGEQTAPPFCVRQTISGLDTVGY